MGDEEMIELSELGIRKFSELYIEAMERANKAQQEQWEKEWARMRLCARACASLPDPEKNIKGLVEAARAVVKEATPKNGLRFAPSAKSVDALGKTLRPFREKK